VASPRSTAPLRSRAAEQGGTGAGRHDHNYHSHTTNHDGSGALGLPRVLRPPGQFGGIDVLVVGLDPPDVAQRVPDPANPVAEAFRLVARGGQNRRTIPAQ
jgi:hypothetical protein